MNNHIDESNKSTILFQHYLIVFLDILGQRSVLREIKDLPTNDTDKEIFLDKIRKSVGKVDKLRKAFQQYFDGVNLHTPNTDLVPPEHCQEFLLARKSDVSFYSFSDSIIVAVPLMGNDEHCTAMNGVYSALFTTCGIGLLSLASTIPLRAGLDIGVGTRIENQEVYGPALERAYYIESNLAEYPRFVIGNELMSYLYVVENQQFKTRLGFVAKNMARLCREMIIRDTDGRYMLDYMGVKFKEAANKSIGANEIKLAYDFVVSQHHKYLQEGNEHLSSRYYRLLQYINSHKNIWGVE